MSTEAHPTGRTRPARHRAVHQRPPRRPAKVLVLVAALIVTICAVVAGARWMGHYADREGATPVGDTPAPPAAIASKSDEPTALVPSVPTDVVAAFQELSDATSAQIGLAYAPVDHSQFVRTLGTWTSGPAWSTIKVPLSLALLRQDGTLEVTDAIRSAITASDNGAAEQIWQALGRHLTAAAKVQSVLADAGQPVPEVQSEVIRPGFSAFGQTQWSLADQVRFLANAACDPRDTTVLDLMGDVIASQQWGLGTLANTKFKGGWGPGTDGSYLVRQYGLITTSSGQLAVAIAAVADSFGGGTIVLNRIAAWLKAHLDSLGGGKCPTR